MGGFAYIQNVATWYRMLFMGKGLAIHISGEYARVLVFKPIRA